jgi:hypothetical protein
MLQRQYFSGDYTGIHALFLAAVINAMFSDCLFARQSSSSSNCAIFIFTTQNALYLKKRRFSPAKIGNCLDCRRETM